MNSQEILQHIDEEIARLQQVKALLQGGNGYAPKSVRHTAGAPAAPSAGKVKRVLSLEARKKIAAAQRRRWAKARKAQGNA